MSDSATTLSGLSPDDKKRLDDTMDAGLRIKQEVADLNGGLKDTVKAVAEELNVKPALIMKAISVAFKGKQAEEKEANDTVQDILDVTGHAG